MGELITAQVERTDHDRTGRHRLNNTGVDFELLLLGGQAVVQVEEFRAVHANAASTVIERHLHLGRHIDVGHQRDIPPIQRDGGQFAARFQVAFAPELPSQSGSVTPLGLGAGPQMDLAFVAVDHDQVAVSHLPRAIPRAGDRRQPQRAGDNRSVRGRTADIEYYAFDLAPLQTHHFRGQ